MKLAALLLALAFNAQAQTFGKPTCAPMHVGGDAAAETIVLYQSGGYMWIMCPDRKAYATVWLWSDVSMTMLGGRLDTIRASADPKAAALASWERNVKTDWNLPKYASLKAAVQRDVAAFVADPDAWAK